MNTESMETYINFETAKLLKEKGFNQKCDYGTSWYANQYYKNSAQGEWFEGERDIIKDVYDINTFSYLNEKSIFIAAPTQQVAMRWLRETHNLYCDIGFDIDLGWFWQIISIKEIVHVDDYPEMKCYHQKDGGYEMKSYEDACEAAIQYCLINLI